MLPRTPELCHLPRVRGRTESGAGLAWTLFRASRHRLALSATSHPRFGVQVFTRLCVFNSEAMFLLFLFLLPLSRFK